MDNNLEIDFTEIDGSVTKALAADDKDALTRLLKDIERAQKAAFPKKRYYKGEKLHRNLPAFIKCLELRAKIHGLLSGSGGVSSPERLADIDEKVLADSKRFAVMVLPKLLTQETSYDKANAD